MNSIQKTTSNKKTIQNIKNTQKKAKAPDFITKTTFEKINKIIEKFLGFQNKKHKGKDSKIRKTI